MIYLDSLTDNISASTNQFSLCMYQNRQSFLQLIIIIAANPVQVDDKTQSRIALEQMLQQMFRIIDGLPINPHTSCQVLQSFGMMLKLRKKDFYEDRFFSFVYY